MLCPAILFPSFHLFFLLLTLSTFFYYSPLPPLSLCPFLPFAASFHSSHLGPLHILQTVTGDTIVHSEGCAEEALQHNEERPGLSSLALHGMLVPEPMFFCTIEPFSASQQKGMEAQMCAHTHISVQPHVRPGLAPHVTDVCLRVHSYFHVVSNTAHSHGKFFPFQSSLCRLNTPLFLVAVDCHCPQGAGKGFANS